MIITIPPARLKPKRDRESAPPKRESESEELATAAAAAISNPEGDGRLGASLLSFPPPVFSVSFRPCPFHSFRFALRSRLRVVVKYRLVLYVRYRHEAFVHARLDSRLSSSTHDRRLLSLLITHLGAATSTLLFSLLLILLIIDYYYCV